MTAAKRKTKSPKGKTPKGKVPAKIELLGGELKWVDEEVLARLQDIASEVIGKSGAIGFIVRELPSKEATKAIFIDEAAKP